MNTETINIEYLKSLGACQDAIDLVERNNLDGFPIDRLNEIEGDFEGYVAWLKGNISSVYPNGDETRYEYDSYGNKILEVYPDGSEYRYEFEYDSNGDMIRKVYPDGDERRYEYDSDGNMIRAVYPDGDECRWEYDSNGNMIRAVYPDGDEYLWGHDSNGNMIREVWPNGEEYRYEYEHYPNGQLKRVGEYLYEYDNAQLVNDMHIPLFTIG